MQHVIDELRSALPPVFAGTSFDELTGNAIHWPTVQNRRSAGEIPGDCFIRSGTKTLVLRDRFLAWWATTLSEAGRPSGVPPCRRRGRAHEATRADAG
jgi:hypothetical protein